MVSLTILALLVSSGSVPTEMQVPPGDTTVPVTVELRRDVAVRRAGLGGQRRGILYADTAFTLKRGARIVMIAVGQEGGCRVRVAQHTIEVFSCPWLPGFADHQRDVFRVVKPESRPRHQVREGKPAT